MIKGTRKASEHVTYTFTEQEFKDLLGIGDDPQGVLTVGVSFAAHTVTVTMSAAP